MPKRHAMYCRHSELRSRLMRVAAVWRYPVKAMQGERVETADLVTAGMAGDRTLGVRDLVTGELLSFANEPRLREARVVRAGVELAIRLPNGETVLGIGMGVGPALSAWLGRRVALIGLAMASEQRPLRLLPSSSPEAADIRGCRPHLVLEGDQWSGRRLRVGDAEVDVAGEATGPCLAAVVVRPGAVRQGDEVVVIS